MKQAAMALENLDRCVVAEGNRDDMGRLSAVIKWCRCRLGADTGGRSRFMVVCSCFSADTFDGAISNKL